MKPLVIALFVVSRTLCAGSLRAADSVDGVQCDKVLAMSVDQWDAYYAKRHGGEETEASDRASLPLYAECLRGRDDRALERLPRATAARIRRYRALVAKMHGDALSLSRDYSGGGMMYIDFFAGAEVDDEQFIRRLIAQKRKTPRGASGASQKIAVRIAHIRSVLRDGNPDNPKNGALVNDITKSDPEFSLQTFRQDASAVDDDFKRIVAVLPANDPAESLPVLGYVNSVDKWLDIER